MARRATPGRSVTLVAAVAASFIVGFGGRAMSQQSEGGMSEESERPSKPNEAPDHRLGASLGEIRPAVNEDRADSKSPQRRTEEYLIPVLPRDSREWQGMLIDAAKEPSCDHAQQCGLARGCVRGKCTACSSDVDCGLNESCAMQHCVPGAAVTCRSRSDCGAEEVCILNGYSSDPRGNGKMTSRCLGLTGGSDSVPYDGAGQAKTHNPPEPGTGELLIEELRR